MRAIADFCPSLTYLDVGRLKDLFDADVEYLAKKCRRLQVLDASYVPDKMLTNRSVRAISQHCKNLTTLRMAFNQRLSDAVGMLSNCMHLQTLHLQHCTSITDGDLFPVVSSCLMLHTLSVRGCNLITDELIGYIADYCLCMRNVDVVDTMVNGRDSFAKLAHSPPVRRSLKEFTSNNMTALHITPDLYRLYKV